jgi:hypothetical protein
LAIFRRGRKVDDAAGETLETADAETGPDLEPDAEASELQASDADDDGEEYFSRARGPFDVSEPAPGDAASRLDLGSIQLLPIDGMQLRLELDETQQMVIGAHALVADSGVQLQAFAAPRTMGLWSEIREEIAQSIVSQGGTADVVRGPLGRELISRMPSRAADGRTVFQPVRFLGVDGPRWFVRAVISGKAALDEAAAAPLVELVRSVVVVRGDEAKPPREILPLKLPEDSTTGDSEPSDAGEADSGGSSADDSSQDAATPRRADDLKPFERGPEITEVR